MLHNEIVQAQILLSLFLLLAGYLSFRTIILKKAGTIRSRRDLSVALLIIYTVVSVFIMLAFWSIGDFTYFLLIGQLALIGCLMFHTAQYIAHHRQDVRLSVMILLFVYLAVLFSVTLFSRGGDQDITIRMTLDPIMQGMAHNGWFFWIRHILMNLVLFVPLGVLIALAFPSDPDLHVTNVLSVSLLTTVLIESMQLTFALGQCDILDILSNTLGGVLGYIAVFIPMRIIHRKGRGSTL